MTINQVKQLTKGDDVSIESYYISGHSTQPLPERGIFIGLYYSESARYPVWIQIVQPRNGKKVTMTFPLQNIKRLTNNQDDMSVYKTAKALKPGTTVNLVSHSKNTDNSNQEFYGKFVKFEQFGTNYKVTISIQTEFKDLSGKEVFEEKPFWGQSIKKITAY